jgi:hypothetical protein
VIAEVWPEGAVIPMSMSCTKCGDVVHNDDATLRHPVDFIQALRDRGWYIPVTQVSQNPTSGVQPHTCPRCR